MPNRWSPTNYVPPPPEPAFVPPTAPTGAFAGTSSGPPTYLTKMFNNLEIQNQTRHDEARWWNNQEKQCHDQQSDWHDEHVKMHEEHRNWHKDLMNWNYVFYNDVTGFMDDCREQPGIMEHFRSENVKQRFSHHGFYGWI